MNTYMIPREAVNENRFLFFTPQAAIFSLVGFLIGVCIVFILNLVADSTGNMVFKYIGWGIAILFATIGYILGTFNMPDTTAFDICKKTGGEPVYVIIKRALSFNKRKKIYIYERS